MSALRMLRALPSSLGPHRSMDTSTDGAVVLRTPSANIRLSASSRKGKSNTVDPSPASPSTIEAEWLSDT